MAKDPFKKLDSDFKTTVENMTDDEIRKRVSEISLEDQRIQNAKKEDQDLKEKAFAYQEAAATYKESAKGAKLRIKYALFILEARGKA